MYFPAWMDSSLSLVPLSPESGLSGWLPLSSVHESKSKKRYVKLGEYRTNIKLGMSALIWYF